MIILRFFLFFRGENLTTAKIQALRHKQNLKLKVATNANKLKAYAFFTLVALVYMGLHPIPRTQNYSVLVVFKAPYPIIKNPIKTTAKNKYCNI